MNEYKIMLVDDEPDILDLLEKALNIEGYYNIIKVDNGLSAVEACRERQPDVIILDVCCQILTGTKYVNKFGSFPTVPFCFFLLKMTNWIWMRFP